MNARLAIRPDLLKLSVKGVILGVVTAAAAVDPDMLLDFFTFPILFFQGFHLLWAGVVFALVKRFLPCANQKMISGKAFARHFSPVAKNTGAFEERYREVKAASDRGALQSAVYWTLVVLAIGTLRAVDMIDAKWLFVITLFFIFMDQFCVSIWCPFRWLMRSKCCNTCRIHNWGYLMAFSPLIFVPSFWTWSIVVLSAFSLLQWEYLYFRHPERFSEYRNSRLMCKECADRDSCRFRRGSRKPAVPKSV